MNPLHTTSKADCEMYFGEIRFEEICFGKIVRFSASKNSLATGITHLRDRVQSQIINMYDHVIKNSLSLYTLTPQLRCTNGTDPP